MTPLAAEPHRVPPSLEEYRALQSQIQGFLQQRTTVFTVVVTGMGALLAFGKQQDPDKVTIAMFALLLGGILLTWQSIVQAMKRMAYLQTFHETKDGGLRWLSALRIENLPPSAASPIFGRLPRWLLLQDYPFAYLLLGLVPVVYVFTEAKGQPDRWDQVFFVGAGCVVILLSVVTLNHANTAAAYETWIREWERVRFELERSK
jgi:hypothetical protein